MSKPLVIGSRGSKLALWQAEYTIAKLNAAGFDTTLKIISTTGDKDRTSRFSEMSGFGFFTGELEEALVKGEVDLAVHSFKDMPTVQPEGLVVAAVSYRADPADVLLVRPEFHDNSRMLELAVGTVVGTSSARRKNQLTALRPDLEITDLRGNVPTRVKKLQDGEYEAIILAAAGIERLQLDTSGLVVVRLKPQTFVPAPAQGILAYEVRKGDKLALEASSAIHDERAAMVVRAERKLLANLNGGCHLPFGAYCEEIGGVCHFWISKSDQLNDFPIRLWIENPDPDVLVVEAWHKMRKKLPQSVFISRELDQYSIFLRAMRKHGIALQHGSLIKFEPLEVKIPKSDWWFFSSRTAVRMMAEHHAELNAAVKKGKVGAIGEGTAKALRSAGIKVHFVADPLDLEKSISAFSLLAGNSNIVFPGPADGVRTAQQIISKNNEAARLTDLAIYSNSPEENFEITPAGITVLTSPMNARTYFLRYPDRKNDQVIAIGSTTAKALREIGVYRVFTSRRPSELAMVEAIFSC